MTLEWAIGADEFMSDIDVMDAFVNKEVTLQEEEDVWEEPYQGFLDSSDMEYSMDQENYEKAVDTYDQFVSAELCLPDERGIKIMARATNRVKYNKVNRRGIEHPTFFADHSLYGVLFPNGQTE